MADDRGTLMDRWELHQEGRETEVFDSPADLGAAAAGRLKDAGPVAAFRLACIGDDGAERDPTAVEQAALAAAMERQGTVSHVHVHKDDAAE